MNDTVTLITSTLYNQIVKLIGGPDYQPLEFNLGEKFRVSRHAVHDLQSPVSIIGGLEAEPTTGRLFPTMTADKVVKRYASLRPQLL